MDGWSINQSRVSNANGSSWSPLPHHKKTFRFYFLRYIDVSSQGPNESLATTIVLPNGQLGNHRWWDVSIFVSGRAHAEPGAAAHSTDKLLRASPVTKMPPGLLAGRAARVIAGASSIHLSVAEDMYPRIVEV